MRLEVGARICEQREAGGVRFRKAIQGKRRDGQHNAVGGLTGDAVLRHPIAQQAFELRHALLGSLEAHGAAQVFGLPAGEARHHHRHPQQLLLEQRHAQRALEDRLEQRVIVNHRFASGAAIQVGMHHLSDDGAGADDGDFDDQVVELLGLESRQRRHLRPRLDLEHADGVGGAQHAVDLGIIRGDRRQSHLGPSDFTLLTSHFRPVIHQPDRVLQHRHHPEPQQIHLDDAHVGAVFLVPLHHHAARHAGVFERHHRRQVALTHHHAAGMLAEVARQVLHLPPQRREVAHARLVAGHADLGQALRQGVGGVDELELVHHLGQAIDLSFVQIQRLPDFARRALAAIGDDVGGHGGAVLPVLLVDVLDHALAAVAARQVEIDVGPFAAFFRQKALEQQFHCHRIDRGDAEAVTHGAVRRRAAALHQDVVLPAEIDDVPHDQEVAGQLQLLDQIQLARHLRAGLVVERPVAIARAHFGDLPQERRLGLARGYRVAREAIAQVGHPELQAIRQVERGVNGLGPVREQARHLRRGLQVALGIRRQAPAGAMERQVFANRRQHVEQRPFLRRGKAHAAGGHQRHAKRLGQAHQRVVVVFLVAVQMPLQFHVGVGPPEHADNAVEQPAHAVALGAQQRPARHGNQSGGEAVEFVDRQRALAFRRPQLHARQQAAEVAPAFLGGH